MPVVAFDTLKYVETLKSAGFSGTQARAMSDAQKGVFLEIVESHVATKQDVNNLSIELKQMIGDLDSKIDRIEIDLNARIDRVEARIDQVEASLNARIDRLEVEFREKFNLLYWMMGFMLTLNVAILIKLFMS